MSNTFQLDAIVMAGGRISGTYARETGATIKALVPVGDGCALSATLGALAQCSRLVKICVVGPPDVEAVTGRRCHYVPEGKSVLENLIAGLDCCPGGASHVLLCASDTPMLTTHVVDDLLDNFPECAEFALPVVSAAGFRAAFPGAPATFVSLATGQVTIGSQIVADKAALRRRLDLFEAMYARRKSQIAMARMLGASFILKLFIGRLKIEDIEEKLCAMTQSRCSAIMGASPELAFDIDTLEEWRDACRRTIPAPLVTGR